MKDNMSIIRNILNHKIIIEITESDLINFLKKLGFKRRFFKRNVWILYYNDERELLLCLVTLRDANFLFTGGHGWSPSAIFKQFRDRGLLSGKFKEIVWTKPGTKIIHEV